jgi:putative ubiquitin-RnfH superfamily antitoxin RatB of RatAB toxin-antitoxin module
VELPEGATVADAVAAAGLTPAGHVGMAVHGESATGDRPLRDGDRVELLRPLAIDPKDARRRRAGA